MGKKLYYKHKTPFGNVRLFRWVIRLWPFNHWVTFYHIGHSAGDYYLSVMWDGRMYGRFYKQIRTHRG